MSPSAPEDGAPDIVPLEPVVRRVIAARVTDPHLVDDLVQETLARVLESRRSLEGGTLVAYAIVSAQNLVVSQGRTKHRRERLGPRLADLSQPQNPEDAVVANEERRDVRRALRELSHDERVSLLAREVEGKDNTSLARELETTPGAVSLRLFRARAKLRVEYLLAHCRVQPPTPACRPVLLSLSAGDRRRQRDLDSGGHLLACASCSALSRDLIERRRPVSAMLPVLLVVPWRRWVRSRSRRLPARTIAGVTAAGVGLTVFLVARSEDPAACGGALTVDGASLSFSDTDRLARAAGRPVEGDNLPVESAPANEGFWLGCADGRLWVQLTGTGESPERISPGRRMGFNGIVVAHPDGFSDGVGVDQSEGAVELDRQGMHLEVKYDDLRLR